MPHYLHTGQKPIMDVHILYRGDTSSCHIWYAYAKEQRRYCPDTNSLLKYNFDIEAKGQGHTEVVNAFDTSSHGNTLICQIW